MYVYIVGVEFELSIENAQLLHLDLKIVKSSRNNLVSQSYSRVKTLWFMDNTVCFVFSSLEESST